MAQISLSKRDQAFLRDMLLFSMRYYQKEIEVDKNLILSCDDADLKLMYKDMLRSDKSRLSFAKDIYNRFSDVLINDL